jgi:glutathione S-transferase
LTSPVGVELGQYRRGHAVALNPLGKIPALVTDDGQVLYDSRVICRYLDTASAPGFTRRRPGCGRR